MFTGIIEEMGEVQALIQNTDACRLSIRAAIIMDTLLVGESVAINGACVTVLNPASTDFSCDISPETAHITNLGSLKAGDLVNLERAMRITDRLSGHLVSGHIEGTGTITKKSAEENAILLSVEIPSHLLKYCIPKGSIALDGVSMTINLLDERGITISVIPHTASATTLGRKMVGDQLNLESDLIGRYVERLLEGGALASAYRLRTSESK